MIFTKSQRAVVTVLSLAVSLASFSSAQRLKDPELVYPNYEKRANDDVISRAHFADQMHGFWLGQSIGNWTGLITEMARVEQPFYTDDDWGKLADPSVWGNYPPHASRIQFYFVEPGRVWGADDDTDIEYMYQHLLDRHNTSLLTAKQIRDGWLKHIHTNEDAPLSTIHGFRENFLWVSNEKAFYLMKDGELLPPATSEPAHNELHMMIDAQLTTEIFGLFAPRRPDIALRMAHLPIRTTAKNEAEWIAEFYVVMHSLAVATDPDETMQQRLTWMADQARQQLPPDSYPAKMYDFVKTAYDANPDRKDWESTRDAVFARYQQNHSDGYQYREPYDAGINFAASLISLFYGEGDISRTIRIGSLCGWDSDNPTATWGGLLGFMLGKEGVEKAFGKSELSEAYWIHRTRKNFPDHTLDQIGEDSFSLMAKRAVMIVDRAVIEHMGGGVDLNRNVWFVPPADSNPTR
jgi:hypothetical protein